MLPGVADSTAQKQRYSLPLLVDVIGSFVISTLTQCRVNHGCVGTPQDTGLRPAWHELSGTYVCSTPDEKS